LRCQSRTDQRLTPNFFDAFIGPCFAAYSRISARCDGAYRFATRFGFDGAAASAVAPSRFAFEHQPDTVPSGIPNCRAAASDPTLPARSSS